MIRIHFSTGAIVEGGEKWSSLATIASQSTDASRSRRSACKIARSLPSWAP